MVHMPTGPSSAESRKPQEPLNEGAQAARDILSRQFGEAVSFEPGEGDQADTVIFDPELAELTAEMLAEAEMTPPSDEHLDFDYDPPVAS